MWYVTKNFILTSPVSVIRKFIKWSSKDNCGWEKWLNIEIFNFPQAHFSMVAMLPGCDKYMKEIHTINQLCSEVAIATKQWKRRRKWKQVHISITNIEYILLYVV